jgi:thioredoxin 1
MELTKDNFSTTLKDNSVVMVDFWAAWCGPCRMIEPIITELEKDFEEKAIIGKVNVDEQNTLGSEFGIRGIPSVLFFKNGELVERVQGVHPKSYYSDKINYY